jgi:hypothetical protein
VAWICPCGASNGDEHGSCRRCGYQFRQTPTLQASGSEEKPTQAEIIAATASENSIHRRQSLAIFGAVLLFVGVFLPIVSMPIVGNRNYFNNGQGDGTIVLVLAVVSIILAITRRFRGLWITGLCSIGLLVLTLVNVLVGLSKIREQMQNELAGNPFKDLADVAMDSVQVQWGWAVLILGGVLIIVAAAMRDHTPSPQRISIGKVIDALAAVCVVMWLLGYFGIMDNWVFRSIPLGTASGDHHASNQTEVKPSPNGEIGERTNNDPSSGDRVARFGDGTFIIGQDIQPGTYRASSPSRACYYARLSGFGGSLDEILANDNTDSPAIVTIQATDRGFKSVGCGAWTAVTSSATTPADNAAHPASISPEEEHLGQDRAQSVTPDSPARVPVTPQPPTATSPAPPSTQSPAPAWGELTWGVLHATVKSEYGEAVFENLPGERLHFMFDGAAWQATIHRQPNGKQTLVMHSLKPGANNECNVRWEIAR